jgi:hypothetical protein
MHEATRRRGVESGRACGITAIHPRREKQARMMQAFRRIRPTAKAVSASTARLLSSTAPPRGGHLVHFRNTPGAHPLGVSKIWVNVSFCAKTPAGL